MLASLAYANTSDRQEAVAPDRDLPREPHWSRFPAGVALVSGSGRGAKYPLHGLYERECEELKKRLRSLAREDERVRRLMTAPGVGPIVALTCASAIDDPARFRSSKAVGAHFGLTPKKYQSGETDVTGRISKIGDGGVRTSKFCAGHRLAQGFDP